MVTMEMKRTTSAYSGLRAETRWIKSLHTARRCAFIKEEPVSSRITTAEFRSKQVRMITRHFMSYETTNNASQAAVKDQFYEKFKKVLSKNRPQREQTILMKDMNAM